MSFDFNEFVERVREANKASDPNLAIRDLLKQIVSKPDQIAAATPVDGEDEVMLFEDESLSIWRCRFQPHIFMPPHEHKIPVHIAGYAGKERSLLFKRERSGLSYRGEKIAREGDVITLGPEAIHAVVAEGDQCSQALHVYMGPLMKLKRGLFDWETGTQIDFTLENFDRLKRSEEEMPEFS
ncbi:MAG: hypothetical protein NXI13_07620 [Proteobacteria bacterium]|nr:hypothetical protein [Pseudomonadota bacterium]